MRAPDWPHARLGGRPGAALPRHGANERRRGGERGGKKKGRSDTVVSHFPFFCFAPAHRSSAFPRPPAIVRPRHRTELSSAVVGFVCFSRPPVDEESDLESPPPVALKLCCPAVCDTQLARGLVIACTAVRRHPHRHPRPTPSSSSRPIKRQPVANLGAFSRLDRIAQHVFLQPRSGPHVARRQRHPAPRHGPVRLDGR